VVARIHADIARVLATPAMRERFASQDATVVNESPQALAELMRTEDAKWSRLIRDAGIRVE
jgi:tripartite-type tricarboxylate transporter receptor subunit TctC